MTTENKPVESEIKDIFIKKKMTLAVAESCTGGLAGHRITNVPGSSKFFEMSLVSYSDEVKNKVLGVPIDVIREFGAVSSQVATAMAKRAKKMALTNVGLGITGIAGPDGGTKEKPVGLVYIAIVTDDKIICKEYQFDGERQEIKEKIVQKALELLREIFTNPS
ncbi:MAG: CinA family protein [bacterium]|nr:CinA family protein [bacterium]